MGIDISQLGKDAQAQIMAKMAVQEVQKRSKYGNRILSESPPLKDGMLSPEEVGANIRKWRTMRGLGVKKLAEKSGVSRNSIRNLETGKCMSFLLTYQYIAEALGVTVGTLLGETGGAE